MDDKASQLDKADAAIAREVAAFMSRIEAMFEKWEEVERKYIVERLLLILCYRMTKLIDDPRFAEHMGQATMKLSDAWPTTGIPDVWISPHRGYAKRAGFVLIGEFNDAAVSGADPIETAMASLP